MKKSEKNTGNPTTLELDALRAMATYTSQERVLESRKEPRQKTDSVKPKKKSGVVTGIFLLLNVISIHVCYGQAQSNALFLQLGPFGGSPREMHEFDDGRLVGYFRSSPTVFESFDDGASWNPASHGFPDNISGKFVQLSNGDIIASVGSANMTFSENGGREWTEYETHIGLAPLVVATTLDEGPDDVLYLAGGQPGQNAAEIFVSDDLGGSWSSLAVIPQISLPFHLDANSSGRIMVLGLSLDFSVVSAVSMDAGQSWTPSTTSFILPSDLVLAGDSTALAIDFFKLNKWNPVTQAWEWVLTDGGDILDVIVLTSNSLLAATTTGVFRSDDNGANWTKSGVDETTQRLVETNSGNILISTLDKIFRSTDRGLNWSQTGLNYAGIGARSVDRSQSGELIVGVGDATLRQFDNSDLGSSPVVLTVPDNIVSEIRVRASGDYVMTQGGDVYLRSAGQSDWTQLSDNSFRHWGFDVSTDGDTIVVTGTQKVLISTDRGQSWTNGWDGIPTNEFMAWNISIGTDGAFYVTTDDGLFVSDDAGLTWTSISNLKLREVYSLSSGSLLTADNQSVYFSADRGITWTQVDYEISSERPLVNLIEMPDGTPGSTECNGLYQSDDDGQTWLLQASWGHICHVDSHIDSSGVLWLASWDSGLYQSLGPVNVGTERADELPVDTYKLSVYPNPTADRARFVYSTTRTVTARIDYFDMTGKQVSAAFEERLGPGTHTVETDLSHLPDGAYLARLSLDGKPVATRTIIRIH